MSRRITGCSRASSKLLSTILTVKRLQSTTTTTNNGSSNIEQFYSFPELPNLENARDTGIPQLFSAQGLKNAYYDRVEHHLDLLNTELTYSEINTSHELEVLINELSKSSNDVGIFNNASLIHNICFAFGSIGKLRGDDKSSAIPPVKPQVNAIFENPDISNKIPNKPSAELSQLLIKNFKSLIEFKTLLLNSAYAINGDGFTWLVARGRDLSTSTSTSENFSFDSLFILNTYNAGSPLNSNKSKIIDELEKKGAHLYESTIMSMDEARDIKTFSEKVTYKPLLAIDASPKNYLHDYGVFGKKLYLQQLWKSIDWDIVQKRLPDLRQSVLP